ncbi:hypothetical protein ABMY35_00975 [Pseudoalteromonas sp. BZB3]|uniref:hypothetical protein n=1 Tax=Pseudoalteromonas sp. BZB3 TaxID=3136670 RepID=UPI0032C3D8CC
MKIKLSKNKEAILILLGLISVYFSLLPGLGETQALILFSIGLLTIVNHVLDFSWEFKVGVKRFCIFIFLFFFIILSFSSVVFSSGGASVFIKYLIAGVIALACFRYNPSDHKNSYVPLYFLLGILFLGVLQSFFGAKLFLPIYSVFMPRAILSSDLAERGVTILAPEQSYMILIVTLVFLTSLVSMRVNNTNSKFPTLIAFLVFFVLVKIIGSALGFIMLVLFFLSYIFPKVVMKMNFFATFISLVVSFAIFRYELYPERFNFVIELVNVTSLSYFLSLVSTLEPSGSTRLILGVAAWVEGIEKVFAITPGVIENEWASILKAQGYYFLENHEVLGRQYINEIPSTPQTLFYSLLGDYGIVPSVIFLVLIFRMLTYSSALFKDILFYFILSYIFIVLFYQSGLTSPFLFLAVSLLVHYSKFLKQQNRD